MFECYDTDLDGFVLCVLVVGEGDDICHFVLLCVDLQDIAKTEAED